MKFAFETYTRTPNDQYVKEIVTFRFFDEHDTFYVPFFHKQNKEGGLFWSTASVGVQTSEKKEYFDGFQLDSRQRLKAILSFLDERRWETVSISQKTLQNEPIQAIKQEASIHEELPF